MCCTQKYQGPAPANYVLLFDIITLRWRAWHDLLKQFCRLSRRSCMQERLHDICFSARYNIEHIGTYILRTYLYGVLINGGLVISFLVGSFFLSCCPVLWGQWVQSITSTTWWTLLDLASGSFVSRVRQESKCRSKPLTPWADCVLYDQKLYVTESNPTRALDHTQSLV